MKSKKLIITTGVIGLIASFTMYMGDMFLYYTTETFANFEQALLLSMGKISSIRLVIGGILGPLSACLFLIGFYHIFLTIKEPRKIFAKIIFILLSISIITGGAYHAFFPAYGIVAKAGYPELI